MSAGRFTVTTSTSPVVAELDGNLAAQLAKPVARARAAMTILTSAQMHAVSRVRLDEEALADYLKATPERARLVARRLANGAPPRELVLCGGCEPALLDDLLCELAGRGLVLGIDGPDGEDMLFPVVATLLQHSDARASFAPRTATPSPIPALSAALTTDACASAEAPLCASPSPGAASLEEVVLREIVHHSPEPAEALFPFGTESPSIVELAVDHSVRLWTSPPPAPAEIQGTPSADQIVALGEPTIVDDTVYAAHEPSAAPAPTAMADRHSDDEDVVISMENSRRFDPTPFASVTSEEPRQVPAKRKKWPMVAFVTATGIVAWAVLHFSTNPISLPRQLQRFAPEQVMTQLPPPAKAPEKVTKAEQDKADEVFYTPAAPDSATPAGHGTIDVSAPEGTVVLVDGTERPRGTTTLPAGNHDVRVRRPAADERGYTIDVRTSRVAHVNLR